MSGPEHQDQGVAGETWTTERASATPAGPIHEAAGKEPSGLPPVPAHFGALEEWLTRVIASPISVADGRRSAEDLERALGVRALDQLIVQSPRMDAASRVGVYRHAYFQRLIECLADDFSYLAKALGDKFAALATDYIVEHPSDHYNLVHFGRHFPAFLARREVLPPAATELARVEWAMVEVMHAQRPAPLDLGAIAALSPEAQARLVLHPSPTLRFLVLEHPLEPMLRALTKGEPWSWPEPGFGALAIYRSGDRLWRMNFVPKTARLLGALIGGATLEAALQRIDDPAAAEVDVMAWFQDWMASGFFDGYRVAR